MKVSERISALKEQMKERNISAYIIGSPDPHQSEYPSLYWRCREFISGFTGSAGTAVVLQDKAGLFTDGRYFIQAASQLEGSGMDLFKMGVEGVLPIDLWLEKVLPEGSVIGFDGKCMSVAQLKDFEKAFKRKKFKVEPQYDLIAPIWNDRPEFPCAPIFDHDVKFAGKSRAEKFKEIRTEIKKKGASAYVIASLDDIAWMFNIRGGDVNNTPVTYAYAFIDQEDVVLFIHEKKIPADLMDSLKKDGVTVKDYDEVYGYLSKYNKDGAIYLDPDRISVALKASIPEKEVIEGYEITSTLKAIKNPVEIANMENSQVRDGVAMVKFMKWIKETCWNEGIELEEADIADKLIEFRSAGENYHSESFVAITGYNANAAMMHYTPQKGTSAKLKREGSLLVDSGGQYYDGTTDITRTFVLGPVKDGFKKDFTTVVRSHIGLAVTRWLYGSTGLNLDIMARRVMWNEGLDYKCGTGHGMGYFLSVHEGPQKMIQNFKVNAPFEEGMIVTNEPGIYKENVWGIRIENTVLVEKDIVNENGTFMKFKTISYCPIDLDGIDVDCMDCCEKQWLNEYHRMVFEKLAPHLDAEHVEYLKKYTTEI